VSNAEVVGVQNQQLRIGREAKSLRDSLGLGRHRRVEEEQHD
jgi:hypothetical protein